MSRNGPSEKLHFLSIAKGSCSELRTQIHIGTEIEYIPRQQGELWIDLTKRIAAMLTGLMKKLNSESC